MSKYSGAKALAHGPGPMALGPGPMCFLEEASWWLLSLSNVGLLSGTSAPVAMHFHKKGMETSYIINKIFRIREIICDILLSWCPTCVQNVFWGPKIKMCNFREKK